MELQRLNKIDKNINTCALYSYSVIKTCWIRTQFLNLQGLISGCDKIFRSLFYKLKVCITHFASLKYTFCTRIEWGFGYILIKKIYLT